MAIIVILTNILTHKSTQTYSKSLPVMHNVQFLTTIRCLGKPFITRVGLFRLVTHDL